MAGTNAPDPTPRSRTSRLSANSTTRPKSTTRAAANLRTQSQVAGSLLVDSLNGLVDDLIRENRRLQKQVEKLSGRGAGTAAAGLERGLKAIQKRIERTLAGAAGKTAPGRRRTGPAEGRSGSRTSTPSPRPRRKPDSS